MTTEPTINEACQYYIDVLNSPPNGWGQHVDKNGVRSDYIRARLCNTFGAKAANAELDRLFEKERAK
jgi:hypothetical protein